MCMCVCVVLVLAVLAMMVCVHVCVHYVFTGCSPALYDAYHEIYNVDRLASTELVNSHIVGPICESGTPPPVSPVRVARLVGVMRAQHRACNTVRACMVAPRCWAWGWAALCELLDAATTCALSQAMCLRKTGRSRCLPRGT